MRCNSEQIKVLYNVRYNSEQITGLYNVRYNSDQITGLYNVRFSISQQRISLRLLTYTMTVKDLDVNLIIHVLYFEPLV